MSVSGEGPVDLVQVDVVDAEPAQAVVAGGHDPAARVSLRVRVLTHLAVHLRGEHHLVPLRLCQRLADDLLGLTEGVHVGGVDEVDAGIDGGMDDADGVVVVRVAEGSEHHRPEAEGADLEAGPSEGAVFHSANLPMRLARAAPRVGCSEAGAGVGGGQQECVLAGAAEGAQSGLGQLDGVLVARSQGAASTRASAVGGASLGRGVVRSSA